MRRLIFVTFIFFVTLLFFSCSKLQEPVLQVQASRINGDVATNTYIYIHTELSTPPGGGARTRDVDTLSFHKRGWVDNTGVIRFTFPRSAVLTLEATHIIKIPKLDTLKFKKIINLETKYQSGENLYEEKVVFNK